MTPDLHDKLEAYIAKGMIREAGKAVFLVVTQYSIALAMINSAHFLDGLGVKFSHSEDFFLLIDNKNYW